MSFGVFDVLRFSTLHIWRMLPVWLLWCSHMDHQLGEHHTVLKRPFTTTSCSIVPVAVVVNDEGDGVLVAAIDEHGFVGLGDSVVSWVFCPNLDVEGCKSCRWPGGAPARHHLNTPGIQAVEVKDQHCYVVLCYI